MNKHSKSKFVLLAAGLGTLLFGAARAGMDAPGEVSFYWEASLEEVFLDFPGYSQDAIRDKGRAFLSSDASSFGSEGVLIWAGMEMDSVDGPRYGMLLVDLDLTRAPLDGRSPMPHDAIRAEYIEKRADQILFVGEVTLGEVWIQDVLYSVDDEGAVEGGFELIFADPHGQYPGSRVFMDAHFVTRPSPAGLRSQYGISDAEPEVYTDVSCGGDVYIGSEGCDCGGEDPGSGGCEGDTTGDAGGCEGDGGGGCEGDGGGGCDGDAGGCDGGGSSSCSGGGGGACAAANAATGRGYHRAAPLRALMRVFPWAIGILFVALLKRKYRR